MPVTRIIQHYPAGTKPQQYGAAGEDPTTLDRLVAELQTLQQRLPKQPDGHTTAYVVGQLAVLGVEELSAAEVQKIHLDAVVDALGKAANDIDRRGLPHERIEELLATLRKTDL